MDLRSLMNDPTYRAYMKRVPPLPDHTTGKPWKLWVRTEDNRWLTRDYASYREVWPVFVNRFRTLRQDATIVSKRVFYAPPGEYYRVKVRLPEPTVKHPRGFRIEERWRTTLTWDDLQTDWCGRCRRPVRWTTLRENHHALRTFPVVSEEPGVRCPICGIRKAMQPPIDKMVRIDL
jgi:hypothetical protein